METPDVTPATTPGVASAKVFACIVCTQKKIKCDKQEPCSACKKAGTECVFRTPAPPRRRKRKLPEADLHARLQRYEEALKGLGVDIETIDGDSINPGNNNRQESDHRRAATHSSSSEPAGDASVRAAMGRLIVQEGKSRLFEKYVLILRKPLAHVELSL